MRVAVRALRWLPATAVAGTIVWLSHRPELPELPGGPPDWILHGVAYGLLTVAIAYGDSDGFRAKLRIADRTPWFAAAAILFGILDELHQRTIPGRDPSSGDVAADAAGALMATVAVAVWWRGGRDVP